MASRVGLLILMIGAFAVIWSGDQPDQIAAVERPANVLLGKVERSAPKATVRKSVHQNGQRIDPTLLKSIVQPTGAPLPSGITAGTYLVVDQYGRTEFRRISARDANSMGAAGPAMDADHYEVESGSLRLHFIRIDLNGPDRNSVTSNNTRTTQ